MSVIDKLIRIQSCKEDIKQAITDKGVDMTNVAFTDYATKISEIQTDGGSGDPEGGSADYLELRANLRDYQSNVESVPNGSFAYCDTLRSVDLPNCDTVGGTAFRECTKLRSVDLPNCSLVGDFAFLSCQQLETVNMPNVIGIGVETFKYCGMLTSVDLPNCISSGASAFEECYGLTKVNIPKLKEIPANMFKNCYSLGGDFESPTPQHIDLPSVQIINDSAFSSDYIIKSISAPNLTRICSNAFYQCGLLDTLDISGSYWCDLEDINAFEGTPLRDMGYGEIYVPNSSLSKYQNDANWAMFSDRFVGVGDADNPLLAFDNGRLYGDTAVLSANFADFLGIMKEDVTSIELANCLEIGETAFSMNMQLSSINLPKCEYIGFAAFDSCNLQSIDLPNCLEINNNAFAMNMQLSSINLPKCEIIGQGIFLSCVSLTSIDLPNIKNIGGGAFMGCENLRTITIGNTDSVCVIEESLGLEICPLFETIYVPNNLVDQYKSDIHWSQFAHIIVGI